MKKFILLLGGLSIVLTSFASAEVIHPRLNASETFLQIGNASQKISLLDLSQIKMKDLQQLTGHKMPFFHRLTFAIAQKKLRSMINNDGTINNKKLENFANRKYGDSGFHLGGFLLGFFLGPIGVIIAYFINDDNKKARVWSAWKGFLALLVLLASILASIGGF